MSLIFTKIFPIISIFIIGVALKRAKVFKPTDGDILLKIVFYLSAPALMFSSISQIEFDNELSLFPIFAVIMIFSGFCVGTFVEKFLKLSKKERGVFLLASSMVNTGFTLPFLIAAYGFESVSRVSLFDFGAAFMVYIFLYLVACKHGEKEFNTKFAIKKLLLNPALPAIGFGLLYNYFNWTTPVVLNELFHSLGSILTPCVMLALGFYFELQIVNLKPTLAVLFTRFIIGFILGMILVTIFGIEGTNREIFLIMSVSPVGYNTITLTALEGLDRDLAASLVSFGILIGLFVTPLMIFLLN